MPKKKTRSKSRMEIDYQAPTEENQHKDRLCGTENCDLRVLFYHDYGWGHINNTKVDRKHHAIPGVFEYPEVIPVDG